MDDHEIGLPQRKPLQATAETNQTKWDLNLVWTTLNERPPGMNASPVRKNDDEIYRQTKYSSIFIDFNVEKIVAVHAASMMKNEEVKARTT